MSTQSRSCSARLLHFCFRYMHCALSPDNVVVLVMHHKNSMRYNLATNYEHCDYPADKMPVCGPENHKCNKHLFGRLTRYWAEDYFQSVIGPGLESGPVTSWPTPSRGCPHGQLPLLPQHYDTSEHANLQTS